MNISKFTQKSLQAVQNLEKTAYDFGNQEIEQEHLLYNLLHQEDSLILKMIEKKCTERQSQSIRRTAIYRTVPEQGTGKWRRRSQSHGR